jgi:pyruvate kinase
MPISTNTPLLKFRRAKIVATLGPASIGDDCIAHLIRAGADVFRLNMSHGDHPTHEAAYRAVRRIAEELGRTIAIFADLCGPKIRVGKFADGGIELVAREQVTITIRDVLGGRGVIPSRYRGIVEDVRPGQRILLADGLMTLEALEVSREEVLCRVVHGGRLTDRKGINLPDSAVSAPSLTEKDRADAQLMLDLGVDYLALSFVRRASDITDLRKIIDERGSRTGIIAKIEHPESLQNAEAIIGASDAVMVARGDLGVELPPEHVPMVQQRLVEMGRRMQRPVIVATQMLESMIENPRPTRAEVSDVATAVTSGADAIMLSGETASGKHPVAAVAMMDRVARQVEAHLWQKSQFGSLRIRSGEEAPPEAGSVAAYADALACATAALSRDLWVRGIVVTSTSGLSLLAVTAARPGAPVILLSDDPATKRRVQLAWGLAAVRPREADVVAQARRVVQELSLAAPGHTIMVVGGFSADPMQNRPSITLVTV